MMNVYERTYDIVINELGDGRKHLNTDSYIAKQIAKRLAEEGLLIMDSVDDEDEEQS